MEAVSTVSSVAPSRVTFANPPAPPASDVSFAKKVVKKPGVKPRSNNTFVLALVGIMFGLAIMYLVTRLVAMTRKMAQLEKQLKQQRLAECEASSEKAELKPLPSGRCPLPLNALFSQEACPSGVPSVKFPAPAAPTKPGLPPHIPLPKNGPAAATSHVPKPVAAAPSAALPVAAVVEPTAATVSPPAAPAAPVDPVAFNPTATQKEAQKEVQKEDGSQVVLPPHVLTSMPLPFPFPPFPGMPGMPGMMVMVDMPEMDPEMELEFASLFGGGHVVPTKSNTQPRVEEVFDVKDEGTDAKKPAPDVQTIVDNALAPLGDVMTALENMTIESESSDGESVGSSSADEAAPRRSARGGRGGGRTAPAAGRGRGRGRGRAAAADK